MTLIYSHRVKRFTNETWLLNYKSRSRSNISRFASRLFIFITSFMVSILVPVFSYSQTWLWAKSATSQSGGAGEALSVSADAGGNVFVTGFFSNPTITFGSTTLTNAGSYNVFIAKYDAIGNVLWAKSVGGTSDDRGYSVSADTGGNVFVTGEFSSSTITFGSITLTNVGYWDVFIAKYDATGNVLWAKSAGGTGLNLGWSVSSDAGGNVFVSGQFSSPTITFGSTILTNAGSGDVFVAKYDATGNVLWAKGVGGTGDDRGYSVSAGTGGNVFVTGVFKSPTITFGSTTLTNAAISDVFIAQYDSAGNILWAKSVGGTGDDVIRSVSSGIGGDMFVTGYFDSPTIAFGSTTLTNAGSEDIFIAKYDAAGNVLWAKSVGGIDNDRGWSVSSDAGGNVFVTGRFSSPTIIFGSTTLTPPVNSVDPMFIVKYDAVGNVLCASALASGGDDWSSASADPFGNVYIGGDFMSSPFIVGSDTLALIGSEDIFVAKYTCSNALMAGVLHTNSSCSGQCTGSATANPSGGTSPYTYSWSNSQTTQTITGLCAGMYSVTITDAIDSSATATIIIAQPTVLLANIVAMSNVSCNALCNGSATATASGGTPAYTFLWNSVPLQTTANATGLCAGNYTVAITDTNGCITTHTVTITEPTAIIAGIAPPGNVSCKGFCNGSAIATASGGTPSYTFVWNTVPLQTTASAIGLCAGNYSVTVTDSNGCNGSDTISIITLYSTPTATFTYQPQSATILDPFIQFTDSSIYNISSWLWSFGDSENGSSSIQHPKYAYTDTGNYIIQLIVTDNHGCMDTIQQSIKISADYIFYVPNSFTPNNDGINDIFIPKMEIIIPADYSLLIFDRWGNTIFETKDYTKGWDGKVKNANILAQEDVYVWTVKLLDFNHQQHDYIGRVTMLK